MTPHEITLILYNLALLPVVFFSILFVVLTIISVYVDRPATRKTEAVPKLKREPHITVQVPTFNDPIALRCLDACRKFRYRNFDIMIIDDSTDKKTAKMLAEYAKKHKGVSYVHRDNREGYKPGALQEAMPLVKGEIIALFDADFVPKREFLTRIAKPFEDEQVAIAQARQGFLNAEKNLVSRFAAYLLQVYHYILMPINQRLNTVLFCGTAGAIRKSALIDVGGWNAKSITEDSELSVRLLAKGYRNEYLPFETPSEVPVTIESFIKQQMRWCFGNIRVFFDQMGVILWQKGLTLGQRCMITFLTLGTIVAPVVILMTIAGFMGWFSGDLRLFGLGDLADFALKFFYTAGFLVIGFVMLLKRRSPKEFPHLLLAAFSISIILAAANSVAIYKAVFRKDKPLFASKQNSWICTPKTGNERYR